MYTIPKIMKDEINDLMKERLVCNESKKRIELLTSCCMKNWRSKVITKISPRNRFASNCESIWNGEEKKLRFATNGKPNGAFVKVVRIEARIKWSLIRRVSKFTPKNSERFF